MPRETIALLGTGMMGAGLGRNLLQAGFDLRVWNRTAAKAAPLAERGATVAASPAEKGELTVLASGPDTARERCQPVFEAIGSRILWLGEAGADMAAVYEAIRPGS